MRNHRDPRSTVRIGVMGCGSVLDQYVAQVARLHGRAEIVLACGRERQRDAAAASGIPCFTTASDDVLSSSLVDLVLILNSAPSHAALARAALKAGKHVLEVITRAQQAAKTGQTLEVQSSFPPLALAGTDAAESAHLNHDRTRSTARTGH